jgi:hypothetical protein
MTHPKYPAAVITVGDMRGPDGNGFAIIAKAESALRRIGVPAEECLAYTKDATSDDYQHLLDVTQEWVSVARLVPELLGNDIRLTDLIEEDDDDE